MGTRKPGCLLLPQTPTFMTRIQLPYFQMENYSTPSEIKYSDRMNTLQKGFYLLSAHVTTSNMPMPFAKTKQRCTHVNSIKYKKWIFFLKFRITGVLYRSILASDSWEEILSIGNHEIKRFSRVSLREQLGNELPEVVKQSQNYGTQLGVECGRPSERNVIWVCWNEVGFISFSFPGPRIDNWMA